MIFEDRNTTERASPGVWEENMTVGYDVHAAMTL